jgi:uncharacterized protein
LDLTRQHPGDKVYVRAVGAAGITVAETTYDAPLILSPNAVEPGWAVTSHEDFSEESFKPLLELDPELVLIGTGKAQHLLDPQLTMLFYRNGVGVEVMDTRAACRTFNVLVMEERKVVAGLIPL